MRGFRAPIQKSPPSESVELVSILVPEELPSFTLGNEDHMTHPLYTPSTARSPKVISFEPLQRGADAAEAAIRAAEDQLVAAMKAEEARAALYAKRD
jgi:hypothetical protein